MKLQGKLESTFSQMEMKEQFIKIYGLQQK